MRHIATISPQGVPKGRAELIPQTTIHSIEPRSIPETTIDQSDIDGTFLIEQDDGAGICITEKYWELIGAAIKEHKRHKQAKKAKS